MRDIFFFYLQAQERMSLNSLKQQRRSGRQFETTRETTIARHHNTEPLAFRELKEAPSANQQINHSGVALFSLVISSQLRGHSH